LLTPEGENEYPFPLLEALERSAFSKDIPAAQQAMISNE
jgi:hypothetical protein